MRRIVLDTNVLLVAIPRRSSFRWIYDLLLAERFTLCVTTEILTEYAEIIAQKNSQVVSEGLLEILLELPNVLRVTPYYRFNLLRDPDDNKFVDCAIAANAHLLVTHDCDFDVLHQLDFPKLAVGPVSRLAQLLNS